MQEISNNAFKVLSEDRKFIMTRKIMDSGTCIGDRMFRLLADGKIHDMRKPEILFFDELHKLTSMQNLFRLTIRGRNCGRLEFVCHGTWYPLSTVVELWPEQDGSTWLKFVEDKSKLRWLNEEDSQEFARDASKCV